MTTLIAFKDRKLSDLLNQKLVELAREAAKFDVDLLASNYRVVPAHRLVLSMYSPYLRRLLKNASPEAKMIVPLIDFPYEVLEKVVELFYYGEIRVLNSLKGKVYKALKFLDVDIPEPPKPPPRPKKTPLDLSIDDDVPVNGVANANEKSLQSMQISDAKRQQPQQQQQQLQQKQRQQKQQPAKQLSNAVSTEAITQNTDAIKDVNVNGNNTGHSGGDAHMKLAFNTGVTVLSNVMVSEGQTDTELATNGASVMSSIVDLNDLASSGFNAFNPSLLYDDDIDINMDELEKSVGDLIEDISIIGPKSIATKNPGHGQTEQTQ